MRFSVIVVLVMTTMLIHCYHRKTDWSVTVYEDDEDYKEYNFISECVQPLTKDGSLATPTSDVCVKLHGRDTNTEPMNTVLFQDINQENLENGEKVGEDLYYSIRIQWIGDANKTEYRFFKFSEQWNTLSLAVNKELEEEYDRAQKEYDRISEEYSRAVEEMTRAPALVPAFTYDGRLEGFRPSDAAKAVRHAMEKEQHTRKELDRVREKCEVARQRIVKDFLYNFKTYNVLIAEIPWKFSGSDFRGAAPVYFQWDLSGLQSAYAVLK